jgi:hypothetical protein
MPKKVKDFFINAPILEKFLKDIGIHELVVLKVTLRGATLRRSSVRDGYDQFKRLFGFGSTNEGYSFWEMVNGKYNFEWSKSHPPRTISEIDRLIADRQAYRDMLESALRNGRATDTYERALRSIESRLTEAGISSDPADDPMEAGIPSDPHEPRGHGGIVDAIRYSHDPFDGSIDPPRPMTEAEGAPIIRSTSVWGSTTSGGTYIVTEPTTGNEST